jgi:signal peptidase II
VGWSRCSIRAHPSRSGIRGTSERVSDDVSTLELPTTVTTADLRRRTLVAVGVVAVADQLSKMTAIAVLGDGERSFGPFRFIIVHNQGGPFGIAAGASLLWTVLTLAVVVAAIIAVATDKLQLRPTLALAAVIGGGLGNLVGRLFRSPGGGQGAVIDWIAVDPYPRVFNLADIALRGGAVILVIAMLTQRSDEPSPPAWPEP